ncbi:MAG: hypothetical protein OJF47_000826 [Nitrospira sp.]|nr:MAG: hypothetical protein OJF47_000826 [Nitrospira sp.]
MRPLLAITESEDFGASMNSACRIRRVHARRIALSDDGQSGASTAHAVPNNDVGAWRL